MWYDAQNDDMAEDLKDYVRQYPYWIEYVPFYVYVTENVQHEDWEIFGGHSKRASDSTFETEAEAKEFFSDLTLLKTEELLKKYKKYLSPEVIS